TVGLRGGMSCVRVGGPPLTVVLAADRKRYWPRRKIKQVAIKRGVGNWLLPAGRGMQGDISPGERRIRIAAEETTKRIERRGRIRIQQRLSQSRLADRTPELL